MSKKKKTADSDQLRTVSLIAALAFIEGKDMSEQNAWKKRFLRLAPGISFPDDFDALPEEEKQRRLDAAIKVGLEKGGDK